MAKKIMVVDDSATIRESISFVMTKAGYEVTTAVSGEDALEQLTGKVDLIITDLNMPGIDGNELIRRIRGGTLNKYTPILMLTTESDPARKEEGKKAGATGWIVKPFQPAAMMAVVEKLLRAG